MSQHGPTMSPDLIYLPFWKIKQGWAQDNAEYEERGRRRQEREVWRLRSRISRTPEGRALLRAIEEKIACQIAHQKKMQAHQNEMQARAADHAKRVQAALQNEEARRRRAIP